MFPGWTKLEAAEGVQEDERADAIEEASLAAQTPEQTAIEMMAHGGGVIEVIKENGQWRVVPDSQYARRITVETEMEIAGPGRRTRPAEDQRRSDRHQGAGHAQQLRRRQDALGHLAHRRGELQRLLRRQRARERPARGRATSATAFPAAVCLGRVGRPLRRRQGAERAVPLRLDGRDRPLRPEPRPRSSAPRSAASSTRAPPRSSTRTAVWSPTWATTSASTTSTSTSRTALTIRPPARPTARCSTTARSTSRSSPRTS